MRRAARALIRTSAFLRKEIVEVLRQPRLVAVLVVGPFLILLVFGSGLREDDPAVRTKFVVDPGSPIAAQIERFAAAQDQRLTVEGITGDQDQAMAELRNGALNLVVVVPDDAIERIRNDEQAPVVAYHNQLDPIESQAIDLFTRTAVDEINQLVLQQLVGESQEDAGQVTERIDVAQQSLDRAQRRSDPATLQQAQRDLGAVALVIGPTAALLREVGGPDDEGGGELLRALTGVHEWADEFSVTDRPDDQRIEEIQADLQLIEQGLDEYRRLSPATIVSPFEGEAELAVDSSVSLSDYYAPAVVALLLQHLVVTFVALSLVREQALGTMELFKVAPMNTTETLVGKTVAYLLLAGVIAAALVAGLVYGLGVPVAGPLWAVVAITVLVLLASIGLGFVLALLAESDSQAVQYAMLLLLASIFLTGFLLSLERFRDWVSWVAVPIPAGPGVSGLRDVMLRGVLPDVWTWGHLGLLVAGYLALAYGMLRRRLRVE